MKNIVCTGYFDTNTNKYEMSMSDIFSHLIRECGRLVEYYNYDIVYDIRAIEAYIEKDCDEFPEDGTGNTEVFWIGLRESGVDGEDFIKNRCCNDYYYRGIYKITINKTERKCSATLEKSSAWDFRNEHNIFK